MTRRIGILTGGGDCPGLNAVLRAVVRTAGEEAEGVEIVGIRDGFRGLVVGRFEPLTSARVSGILPRGGTILGSSNRDDPFRWRGPLDGEEVVGDVSERAVRNAQAAGLEGIVVVGGDGTQLLGHRLSLRAAELGVALGVVGVPKTIDNDLRSTDRTFGFDTAVSICCEAIDRIHTTAESHHRVMFVEVMGRTAGWIALHAGLASGGDVILIPEIPYRLEAVAAAVAARTARGKSFSIVVVAEGARAEGEAAAAHDARFGGVAARVAERLEAATGHESRTTILGHVQRGGTPTAFDRVLATRFGVRAAREALAGRWGTMASLRGDDVISVPLADVVGAPRLVDPAGELVSAARATGVRFGDV